MLDIAPHIVESTLLLLSTFLVGCVIGYFLHRAAARRTRGKADENTSSSSG